MEFLGAPFSSEGFDSSAALFVLTLFAGGSGCWVFGACFLLRPFRLFSFAVSSAVGFAVPSMAVSSFALVDAFAFAFAFAFLPGLAGGCSRSSARLRARSLDCCSTRLTCQAAQDLLVVMPLDQPETNMFK